MRWVDILSHLGQTATHPPFRTEKFLLLFRQPVHYECNVKLPKKLADSRPPTTIFFKPLPYSGDWATWARRGGLWGPRARTLEGDSGQKLNVEKFRVFQKIRLHDAKYVTGSRFRSKTECWEILNWPKCRIIWRILLLERDSGYKSNVKQFRMGLEKDSIDKPKEFQKPCEATTFRKK